MPTSLCSASRPAKEHVVQGVDLSLNPRWSYCGHCEAPGPHLDIASGNRTWLRAWRGCLTFLSQAIWMYGPGRHQAALLQGRRTLLPTRMMRCFLDGGLMALRHRWPRLDPESCRWALPSPFCKSLFPAQRPAKKGWPHSPRQPDEPGWGFVLFFDGQVFYDFGVIKPEHLAPFATRRLQGLAPKLDCLHRRRGAVCLHEGLRQGSLCQWDSRLILGLGSRQWSPDFYRVNPRRRTSRTLCLGGTTPGHELRDGRG